MKKLLVTIFVTSHFIAFSQAKDTTIIIPGNKLLQWDKLKEYKNNYDFFRVKDGAETKIGGIDDNFFIITRNKITYGLRVSNIIFGENKILDSGLCNLNGLVPIWHKSHQTKKIMNLDFGRNAVTGVITNLDEGNNKKVLVNHKLSTALFDSYYEDVIAKTIQFKEGFIFKFPEYIYERGGTVWSSGEVAAKKMVQDKTNKTIPVWTVIFYEKGVNGEITRTTTYLIAESDRTIISREYKVGESRILMKERI